MIGFEFPAPGESSIIHNELSGKKLGEVVNIICNGGTEKELRVCAMLEIKHKGLVVVKLMRWHNAQYFKANENLELEILKDLEVEEVREAHCGISVYVKMKDVECVWYK